MLVVVLAALFVIVSVQMFFSYLQMKGMYATISEIKKEHKGSTGILAMGSARSLYSLGKGVVVAIVVDDTNTVIDYREMRGRTVFSKMKRREELNNLTVDECLSKLETKKERKAFESALQQIRDIKATQSVV